MTSPSPTTDLPRRPRFPGWIARLVIAVPLGCVLAIRLLGRQEDPPVPLGDPALRNLLTLLFCFVSGLTAWLWFCFRSGYSVRSRRLVFVGSLLVIVGFFATFRYREVTGSMVPSFDLRWSPSNSDRELSRLEGIAADERVDLVSSTPHDFPQFLGPDRSGWISGPQLARDWAGSPPKLLWKQPLGAGWSAFAAVNGYAVTMEQRGPLEWVTCYEVATGKPVWGHSIEARHENALGGIGPRGTPTIHQGRVYALGATGVLRCLDGASGKLLWSDDLRKRYGLSLLEDEALVMWGRAASPLIVDQLVVVPGGGPAGKAKNLVAFDATSGSLIWESENKKNDGSTDQISYASPSLATLASRRQIIIVNESTSSGHDPATGERLWSQSRPGHSNGDANSSQAVAIGNNQVLLSKGYGGGAELIELSAAGDSAPIAVTSVWKVPRVLSTKFTNVVIHQGHAFGLSEGILECVELTSGQRKWKSGRYEHGQILGVGDLLLVLSEEGDLHLLEANPTKFMHLGSIQALAGKTWNNLCLTGNRLLIRNAREAACYELP
jgi:outer membrane protein assembly factor BamB